MTPWLLNVAKCIMYDNHLSRVRATRIPWDNSVTQGAGKGHLIGVPGAPDRGPWGNGAVTQGAGKHSVTQGAGNLFAILFSEGKNPIIRSSCFGNRASRQTQGD